MKHNKELQLVKTRVLDLAFKCYSREQLQALTNLQKAVNLLENSLDGNKQPDLFNHDTGDYSGM